MDFINEAKRVFDIEINALEKVKNSIDESFADIVDVITKCEGKVIIVGMGKSGHIGKKIAATFASLGTSSFFLHPAEALHGDLGMVESKDVVIVISYSGESEEITRILANIKVIGAILIGISQNPNSTLIKHCDYAQIFPSFDEACYLNLAPTSSTTVAMTYGDALAITASKVYGFTETNFGLYHPAGSLGKKLLVKVKDVMATDIYNSTIIQGATLKNAIIELSEKGLGIVTVIDKENTIVGVVTDGDLRRQLEKGVDVYDLSIDDVMTKSPTVFNEEEMAIDALQKLRSLNISSAPVINSNNKIIGTIKIQEILNKGIIL